MCYFMYIFGIQIYDNFFKNSVPLPVQFRYHAPLINLLLRQGIGIETRHREARQASQAGYFLSWLEGDYTLTWQPFSSP